MSSGSLRSAVWTYAVPPSDSISSATSWSWSLRRATSSIVPPASPISSAAALPIPDEAPVIITVRPVTASLSERASTSPAPGMRCPKARSVRMLSKAMSNGFGGAMLW